MLGQYRRSANIQAFLARYVLALLVTAVALVATFVLRRYGPTPSFLFFVPAVAISAWYGGPGPSAVATAVSLLLIDLNFLAPGGSLRIDRVEALEIIAFLIVAATITSTMEALHRSRALAESRAAELKRLNDEVGRSYHAERDAGCGMRDARRLKGAFQIGDHSTDGITIIERLGEDSRLHVTELLSAMTVASRLPEIIEQVIHVGRRDPRSGIGDVKCDVITVGGGTYRHASPFRSEFDRVTNDVADDLRHTKWIGAHGDAILGRNDFQLNLPLLRERPK